MQSSIVIQLSYLFALKLILFSFSLSLIDKSATLPLSHASILIYFLLQWGFNHRIVCSDLVNISVTNNTKFIKLSTSHRDYCFYSGTFIRWSVLILLITNWELRRSCPMINLILILWRFVLDLNQWHRD